MSADLDALRAQRAEQIARPPLPYTISWAPTTAAEALAAKRLPPSAA